MFIKKANASQTATGASGAAGEMPAPTRVLDAETGLPNYAELAATLRREIARAKRYGDRSALAVFDVRVATFKPSNLHPNPPSPARFVASILTQRARDSDLVARLDATHFVVFLTECDAAGASLFTERARTQLSSLVFARNEDGTGIFVRAWAGFASWDPAFTEPNFYIQAAMAHLESQRPAYRAAESEFRARRPTG